MNENVAREVAGQQREGISQGSEYRNAQEGEVAWSGNQDDDNYLRSRLDH